MTPAGEPESRRRRHRRVRVPGVPGSDPEPGRGSGASERAANDTDRVWGDGDDSNDARLRRDIPPHWGSHH